MEVGIEFQLIWHDNDVLNLRVLAWNGDFGGVAEIYEGVGDLHVAASNLRGFPNNPSDRREIVFGNFDRKCAADRSEEHTSELQSHVNLVCRLLLEKKKKKNK